MAGSFDVDDRWIWGYASAIQSLKEKMVSVGMHPVTTSVCQWLTNPYPIGLTDWTKLEVGS